MSIPAFDGILNILPPHLGNPTNPADLSPYPCSLVELCTRFDTTPARKKILKGLLDLRAELFLLGVLGFQWVGGSFVEDIETSELRDPQDVDVITIANAPDLVTLGTIVPSRLDLFDPAQTKSRYLVDHYLVSLS